MVQPLVIPLIPAVLAGFWDRFLPRENLIETKEYFPPSVFITDFPDQANREILNFEQVKDYATAYLIDYLQQSPDSIRLRNDTYCSGDFCHLYFENYVNGLVIDNHSAQMTTNRGKIIAMSYNFGNSVPMKSCPGEEMPLDNLIKIAESHLNAKVSSNQMMQVGYNTGNYLISGWKLELWKDLTLITLIIDNCFGEIVSLINMTTLL
jgi:hypothetical protein